MPGPGGPGRGGHGPMGGGMHRGPGGGMHHRGPMGGGMHHRGHMGHRPPPPPMGRGYFGGRYRRPYRGGCGCCGPMMVMLVGAIVGLIALLF